MKGNFKTLWRRASKRCVTIFKWLPVVIICLVLAWSYYSYVVQFCFLTLENVALIIFLLICYHILFSLLLWSYWKTIYTNPGFVPKRFKLSSDDMEIIENAENLKEKLIQFTIVKDIPVLMRSVNGEVRYCVECCHVKPDRCHHCSICGQCILKMDHHCPWVNNCVAFNNYKFFLLFVGYSFIYCFYIAASTFGYFLQFWNSPPNPVYPLLLLFFVSSMFGVSTLILFSYHIYLVLMNMTTLESIRAPIFEDGTPAKRGYHLGYSVNFQEIFGDSMLYWWLPIPTSFGDGIIFPRQLKSSDEEIGLLSDLTSNSSSGLQDGRRRHSLVEVSAKTENIGSYQPITTSVSNEHVIDFGGIRDNQFISDIYQRNGSIPRNDSSFTIIKL